MVLRWDTRREEKGKHGKFDSLWYGPYRIVEARSNNTFMLENLDGEKIELCEWAVSKTLLQELRFYGSSLYISGFLIVHISSNKI